MTKNDHLYGDFNFTLKAYNPNSRVSIYYDIIEVKLFYNSQQIAFNNAETFFQPRRNVTYLDLFLSAKDVALYGDVARGLKTERTSGAVQVEIKVRAKIRFKVGIWKSSHRKVKLSCSPSVPVSSTKNSQTYPCDLDL
ncbi:NDR1/HIN1-like protein 3 [Lycium barbarum]|uniref:NDR1/HIN1-like protein 3 n=1 Tax=Lycium barbarum TaxID=112863 RepID=UPI00293E0A7A|nr:NDR1/HIN1-like protein 3 [Lycium barbarum]